MDIPNGLKVAAIDGIKQRLRDIVPDRLLVNVPHFPFEQEIVAAAESTFSDALIYIHPASEERDEYSARIHRMFAPSYLMISGVSEEVAKAIVDHVMNS